MPGFSLASSFAAKPLILKGFNLGTASKAEQIGRKIGEQAMGAAIRGLIGAAALVDLERVERDHDREG